MATIPRRIGVGGSYPDSARAPILLLGDGASIRVGFVQRLRDERAFESLEALRSQIESDCGRARVLFDRLSL